MITENTRIDNRILRDMNDGVLVLDTKGTILQVNRIGRDLLELSHDPTGDKYVTLWGDTSQNDAFHQLVLDAVYDKENNQTGVVSWIGNGTKRFFKLTVSFLRDEDGDERVGVVVLFRDVTEEERLKRQHTDGTNLFGTLAFLMLQIYTIPLRSLCKNLWCAVLFRKICAVLSSASMLLYVRSLFPPLLLVCFTATMGLCMRLLRQFCCFFLDFCTLNKKTSGGCASSIIFSPRQQPFCDLSVNQFPFLCGTR